MRKEWWVVDCEEGGKEGSGITQRWRYGGFNRQRGDNSWSEVVA